MKAAFDLTQVLDRKPRQLGVVMHELKHSGHQCIVFMDVPKETTFEVMAKSLQEIGIMPGSYDLIVGGPDGVQWKSDYCRDNQVDLLIDNDVQVILRTKMVSPMTCCLQII